MQVEIDVMGSVRPAGRLGPIILIDGLPIREARLDRGGRVPRRGAPGRRQAARMFKGGRFGTASYKRTFLREACPALIASGRRSQASCRAPWCH